MESSRLQNLKKREGYLPDSEILRNEEGLECDDKVKPLSEPAISFAFLVFGWQLGPLGHRRRDISGCLSSRFGGKEKKLRFETKEKKWR